jgi:hypothetical protein
LADGLLTAYNETVKENVMRWHPLWIAFVASFFLLALPRASYACPA